MKSTKFTSILCYILIVSMLCLTGCKKNEEPDASTETTGSTTASTTNQTQATQGQAQQPTMESIEPTKESVEPTKTPDPTETTAKPCVHVLGGWTVEKTSTCTTEGKRSKLCTLCKEAVETEAIPTTDHAPGNWIVDKKATCTAEGTQHQECSQCKKTVITITVAKTAHTEVDVKGYAATPTQNGLTDGKKCSVCDKITQPQYIIPAGSTLPG